jgi:hypothetical protein
MTLADSWRRVLADDPTHARPTVAALLKGRATFTPRATRRSWKVQGDGTIAGLFTRVLASGLASPTGTQRGCSVDFRRKLTAA